MTISKEDALSLGATLSETLEMMDLAHTQAKDFGPYAHDVVAEDGLVLFTGTASDVWTWIRQP